MAYLEQLQAGLRYLGRAGESGRKSLDKVVAPVNGAISEIRGAAAELENLPGVSPEMAARLQRAMRGIGQAQGKVAIILPESTPRLLVVAAFISGTQVVRLSTAPFLVTQLSNRVFRRMLSAVAACYFMAAET